MKTILVLFIFLGFSLQAIEYSPSIGGKLILPLELPDSESTAKCGRTCMGSINSELGYSFVFNNNFKITDLITINFGLSYEYGNFNIGESHAEDPSDQASPLITDYNYDSHIIKINPAIKFFHTSDIYSNFGLTYDFYINKPDKLSLEKVSQFALSAGIGFLYDNIAIELSIEGIKAIDIEVKSRSYINTSLTVLYNF